MYITCCRTWFLLLQIQMSQNSRKNPRSLLMTTAGTSRRDIYDTIYIHFSKISIFHVPASIYYYSQKTRAFWSSVFPKIWNFFLGRGGANPLQLGLFTNIIFIEGLLMLKGPLYLTEERCSLSRVGVKNRGAMLEGRLPLASSTPIGAPCGTPVFNHVPNLG